MIRTELLREKDPTFIQDTRIEGNLSVVNHPNNPSFYGNGSVEVGGTLSTDALKSATPNSVVEIGSPLSFVVKTMRPDPPIPSQTQLFSDDASAGRLVMVNSEGSVIDINPLQRLGDLMTFDAVKNTTVRLPRGLPEQTLRADPLRHVATGLGWKSDYANAFAVVSSSSTVKYLEVINSTTPTTLGTTPALVPFSTALRTESDAYSVGTTDFIILQEGAYQVAVHFTVGFDETQVLGDEIGSVQFYIEHSGPSGYTILPGSRTYATFPARASALADHTLSNQFILTVVGGTRVRVWAQEMWTNGDKIAVKGGQSRISVQRLDFGSGDASQYLSVQGLTGARPAVGAEFGGISTNTVTSRSNPADVITGDSIKLFDAGLRHVFGKATFLFNSIPPNSNSVVVCRLTQNGVVVPGSEAVCSLISGIAGDQSFSSASFSCLVNAEAQDLFRLEARIESTNHTTGAILADSEECSLHFALLTPGEGVFTRASLSSNSMIPLTTTSFTPIEFDVTDVTDTGYVSEAAGAVSSLAFGGTFRYTAQLIVEIPDSEDSSSYVGLFRAVADLGAGFKEIEGTDIRVTLSDGMAETIILSGTFYAPPHSRFQIQGIAIDGGNLQVRDGSARLLVEKIEHTVSPFSGLSDFGRYYKYVTDDPEVQTTSTLFALRIAAVTFDLPAGRYRIGVAFEWDMSRPGVGFEAQLVLDDNTLLETFGDIPVTVGSYRKVSFFMQTTLGSGLHTIAFNTRVLEATRALLTRKCRIEIWHL